MQLEGTENWRRYVRSANGAEGEGQSSHQLNEEAEGEGQSSHQGGEEEESGQEE
jgi:hypothetical protein